MISPNAENINKVQYGSIEIHSNWLDMAYVNLDYLEGPIQECRFPGSGRFIIQGS